MILVEVSRPNTVGVTISKEFDSCEEAFDWIDDQKKKLKKQGWNISEREKNTDYKGTIEATHDDEADLLLIDWIAAECDTEEIEENKNPSIGTEHLIWVGSLLVLGFIFYKLKQKHKNYSYDFVQNQTPIAVAGVRG